ncbi:MAG TPA: hypothetical protein V6D12_10925 [Candidatus Obscuribacterales bacterium]
MKRTDLSNFIASSAMCANLPRFALASIVAILPLALPASVRAEAPIGESYAPPRELTEDTNTTPSQVANDIYTAPRQVANEQQVDLDSNFERLGFLALSGIAEMTTK